MWILVCEKNGDHILSTEADLKWITGVVETFMVDIEAKLG